MDTGTPRLATRTAVVAAIIIGFGALALFTTLLVRDNINEATYSVLIGIVVLLCVTLLVLPRLHVFDLKGLKITLHELKEAQAKAEKTINELAEMYGGIENLRREPFVLDEKKQAELGIDHTTIILPGGAMRYVSGCIKRERERLAKIFIADKKPEELAQAILDASFDDRVFKWNGPEASLDMPPISHAERQARKEQKKKEQAPQTPEQKG